MWLPAPRPPSSAGLTALLLTTLLTAGVAKECEVNSCTTAFMSATSGGPAEGPTWDYCALIRSYVACLEEHRTSCHGDLNFHAAKAMVDRFYKQNNCSNVLGGGDGAASASGAEGGAATGLEGGRAPVAGADDEGCRYYRSEGSVVAPAHCGLFGDPHLKTFGGAYMTCRVQGAWPLLNTPHLAVQVTNEPVGPDNSNATATTKVTVMIKAHPRCGSRRTYEASTESLPKAFVDGTTWSGGSPHAPHIQVREASPGEHVLITVSYINATVAVRKIETHLAVLVTLPESLLEEFDGGDEVQLCLQGCHAHERLDRPGAAPLTKAAMTKGKAKELCKQFNVTDYYLDSCIFDLMATGDVSFGRAAQAAQKDLWEHDPIGAQKLLLNCSDPPCMWEPTSSSLAHYPSLVTILLALLLQG